MASEIARSRAGDSFSRQSDRRLRRSSDPSDDDEGDE
jgi:hypothetical protein